MPFRPLFSFSMLALALAAPAVAQVPAASARIQSIPLASSAMPRSGKTSGSVKLQVEAASDWKDTGVAVLPGETLTLTAQGAVHLADGRSVTPDGIERGWKDLLRSFPADQAKAGALIGRIGDSAASVPFTIGEHSEMTARQPGELLVRANVAPDAGATGVYTLQVRVAPPAQRTAATAAQPVDPATALAVLDVQPRRVADADGNPGDVVNFALLGTAEQVDGAFARSGWIAVDATVNDAVLHGLLATLAHQPYVEMPMSKLYLFGRSQDRSYARAEALKVAAVRHHLRVWNTGQTIAGRPLWIGSATYDNGLERDQRNGNVTHSIDPEIDNERRFLLDSFVNSGSVSSAAYVTPPNPVREAHTATGGSFHTDGRILLLGLSE